MSSAAVFDQATQYPHLSHAQVPQVRSWHHSGSPLPVRPVRQVGRRRMHHLGTSAPPWIPSGPDQQPFDFCGQMRRLCADITQRCPVLRHIDISRLLFSMTQARTGAAHGLQARVTPMRFRDGQLLRTRRGTHYQVQRYFLDGREILYVVAFCLPRFLDQSFDDKFITIFHELYHISPAFDGDLRRHGGRYDVHSHSKRGYDNHMAHLAREYLSAGPDPALHAFLRLNFEQLLQRHSTVVAAVVPRPRLIPLANPDSLTPGPPIETISPALNG